MRIAQVYPHLVICLPHVLLFDALAIVIYQMARRLARDHQVVVYPRRAVGQPAIDAHEGVIYRRVREELDRAINSLKLLDATRLLRAERPFRLSTLYYPNYARRVGRDIHNRRCQIVHIHGMTPFIPVMRRFAPEARIVLHMHDHSLADFDPALLAPRLAQTALVLGCSEFVTAAIRERFPAIADRCHTLHNGVDRRFLDIRSDPAHSQTVLFIGRISPEKGVHVLLDAMRRLASSHPEASLTIVGPADVAPRQFVDPLRRDGAVAGLEHFLARPGAYSRELSRQIRGTPMLHVQRLGAVAHDALTAHYAAAGVFVFPSVWHEPFGLPVIEAMAAGLPVVATRGGAFPEVIVDGQTGFLVERGDVQSLSRAISTLLANPGLRARMGAAGRARVASLFTWERSVSRLVELYEGVLDPPRSASCPFSPHASSSPL